jgi:hypothetical protein
MVGKVQRVLQKTLSADLTIAILLSLKTYIGQSDVMYRAFRGADQAAA